MKIIYISNSRIPTEKAHGFQIVKMCDSFAQSRAEVELILPDRSNREFKGVDIFRHYGLKNNFQIVKLKSLDPTWLFKAPAGFYIKIQSLFFMNSLRRWLRRQNLSTEDILYTRDELLMPLLLKFSKNVIWESHALPRRLDFYKKYIQSCRAIMPLTLRIKEDLVKLGIAEAKILVSPDAVDLEVFDINMDKQTARQELHLEDDKIILGYTGSLKTKGLDKGVSLILRAAVKLKSGFNNLQVVLVGGSLEDIEFYSKQCRELGVEMMVTFIPKVDQRTLAIYQKAFDILLMPFPNIKHYAHYMSPLKMFEYLAAKRPIIASDLPSIREVLSESSCFFVKAGDSEDLANVIKQAMTATKLSTAKAAEAYVLAGKYSWQQRAKNITDFINHVQ